PRTEKLTMGRTRSLRLVESNFLPVEMPTHQSPPLCWPMTSARLSRLPLPETTLPQLIPGAHAPQGLRTNALPVERSTYQRPRDWIRPARSVRPSPSKSPVTTSTQMLVGRFAHGLVVNAVPVETLTTHFPVVR